MHNFFITNRPSCNVAVIKAKECQHRVCMNTTFAKITIQKLYLA